MSLPNTKAALRQYIIRKLGGEFGPVELSDDNLEDIIGEAVKFFQENYYEFSKEVLLKIPIDSYLKETNGSPKDNIFQYQLDDNIFSINQILRTSALGIPSTVFGTGTVPSNEIDYIFNAYSGNMRNTSYVDLEILLQNYQFVQDQFLEKWLWDYNSNTSILTIKNNVLNKAADYIYTMATSFDNLSSDTLTSKYYQNKQFRDYIVLLASQQMYNNLKKFDAEIPGSIRINVDKYDVEDKIKEYEEMIINSYGDPSVFGVYMESDV